MLYTINGRLVTSTTQTELRIPLNASSKLVNINFSINGDEILTMGFSDENNILDLNLPGTDEFVINDKPNSYVLYWINDSNAGKELVYNVENFNIQIENELIISHIAGGTQNLYFTITLEYTEQPIDAKNTLVRDLAEAVTQVADGENLITAGEVFFQKRIRGLKQVAQGGFNN